MKKSFGNWVLGFGILMLGFATLVAGCAQTTETATTTTCASTTTTTSATGSTTTTSTTTTTSAGGKATISGSINSGTVASAVAVKAAGVKTLAAAYGGPIQNDTVVAVAKETGRVYFADAKTDSSGNFTISNLPAGNSYYLEILDSSNRSVAPVAFGTSGGKTVMAIDTGSQTNINLGQVTYDSSKGAAAPVTEPTSLLDADTKVDPKSGETLVPRGADNFGKGSEQLFSGTYDSNKVDGDLDGRTNPFDASNNGDLTPDEFDGLYTREALSEIEPANFYTYVFSNLKVDYDQRNTFQQNYTQFNIAIGVVEAPKDGAQPKSLSTKSIQSVKAIDGPAWIQKAEIEGTSTLWSANNYNVPLKSATPEGIYEVHVDGIKPLTDVNAGDILKFLVTYTDGSSEEAAKMLNFVFTDIPRVNAHKQGSGAWQTINGVGPGTATTTEVTLRWTRPKDENNSEIMGGKYTFEYASTTPDVFETTIITKDADSTLTSLEGYCNFATLPSADLSGSELFIGVCIRSIANDNSAENLRFTKGW